MKFAERLKQLMDENQTSNYELGKSTGTHPTTVSNWLNGAEPQPRKIKAIADYYNVSIEYLKGESDAKEKAASISESGLTADELDFILKYRSLSPEKKEALRVLAEQK